MSYLADIERKYVAALERIKVLEEEAKNLRAAVEELSAVPQIPLALKLTKREGLLFSALLSKPSATKEQLMAMMYADRYDVGEEPGLKIIHVFVQKVRHKIKPFGLEIGTIWGVGYAVSAETKAAVRRMNDDLVSRQVRDSGRRASQAS
jgi:two-component system cell cycle response regulator CtrA